MTFSLLLKGIQKRFSIAFLVFRMELMVFTVNFGIIIPLLHPGYKLYRIY
jgi:hypothetical protein